MSSNYLCEFALVRDGMTSSNFAIDVVRFEDMSAVRGAAVFGAFGARPSVAARYPIPTGWGVNTYSVFGDKAISHEVGFFHRMYDVRSFEELGLLVDPRLPIPANKEAGEFAAAHGRYLASGGFPPETSVYAHALGQEPIALLSDLRLQQRPVLAFDADDRDLAWIQGGGEIPYKEGELWAARSSLDPAVVAATAHRVRVRPRESVGKTIAVGCGRVSRFVAYLQPDGSHIDAGFEITELATGRSWSLPNALPSARGWRWLAPQYITCEEAVMLVNDGETEGGEWRLSLARVRFADLGEPEPPYEP